MIKVNITSKKTCQYSVPPDDTMHQEALDTTSVIILPKMHNLNLIKKSSDESNLEVILQNKESVSFLKGSKLWKTNRNCHRLKCLRRHDTSMQCVDPGLDSGTETEHEHESWGTSNQVCRRVNSVVFSE